MSERHTELMPGVTAIIAGGHFDGSMMLHVAQPALETPFLFHADTIFAVPTGDQPDPTRPGIPTFSFMWSVPNMIPMSPDKVLGIWQAMKGFEFKVAYGLLGTLKEKGLPRSLPQRVLDSAKIFVKHMGYENHQILAEDA